MSAGDPHTDEAAWDVHPHGPLQPVGEGNADPALWALEGSLPRMPLPRTMAVARLASGGLLVHAPCALDDEQLERLLALGRPEILMAPSAFHRLQVDAWAARFPEARVVAPGAAIGRVAELPGLAGRVESAEDVLAAAGIAVHEPDGIARDGSRRAKELVVEVPLGVGGDQVALIFGDLLFAVPHQRGLTGLLLRLVRTTGGPRVTPIAKRLVVESRRRLAHWFRKQATRREVAALLPGHGAPIAGDVPSVLEDVARRLR